jgi:hypothetical protein
MPLLLIFLFVLSSCLPYYYQDVYQKNVTWKTEDDRLGIFIEGPTNENEGLAIIRINDEFIDTYAQFGGNNPLLTLYFEDKVDNSVFTLEDLFIQFSMNIIDDTKIQLEVKYNNTNDESYDNLSFEIYRSTLSEDELNGMYYLNGMLYKNTVFCSSDYGITLEQDKHTIFSGQAEGTIHYQDQTITIEFVYVDTTHFEIYELDTQGIVLSGTYLTGINSMTLSIDNNTFFDESVQTIELSITESN